MSFETGLSGLTASSKSLDVIGNNIANANTVGMKSGRAEFAEMISTAIGVGGGGSNAGIGVNVAAVTQNFSQGNITVTNNTTDVAINGSGFFVTTQPDGTTAYSRDGQFKLTSTGKIVTNTGGQIMGYPTDTKGNVTSVTLQPMSLPTGAPIPAQATSQITGQLNLDSRAVVATSTTPPTAVTTYGTSLNAYDSQGVQVPVSFYFVKTDTDTWSVYTNQATATAAVASDGTSVPATNTQAGALFNLHFDTTGKLASATDGTGAALTPTALQLTLTSPNPNIGNYTSSLDLSGVTQFGAKYAVTNLTQNGYSTGELTGINIDASGVIMAKYSNGQSQAQGMVALADFRNDQGLSQIAGGSWVQTFASGDPLLGQPGSGKFGALQSGALEESNVDLTAELVNMMTAQRAYQANAQTIKTQDQIMSTLVNLR